jgi:hypothetical protein
MMECMLKDDRLHEVVLKMNVHLNEDQRQHSWDDES